MESVWCVGDKVHVEVAVPQTHIERDLELLRDSGGEKQ